MRILGDYLTASGFLTKTDGRYGLAPDAAAFLNRQSPAYMGSLMGFLAGAALRDHFAHLTESVRRGGSTSPHPTTEPEYPAWIEFAEDMVPLAAPAAGELTKILGPVEGAVLDVAAGHGIYGITIAQANPAALVTALDWPKVVAVARANALKAGIEDRYSTISGDAFQVALGGPYQVILLTNLLHHFDKAGCVALLKRMREALKPGGRVATVEFIPNPDRVSPYLPAIFPMIMLASTPAGDAYTEAEFRAIFEEAGFAQVEFYAMERSPEQVIISRE